MSDTLSPMPGSLGAPGPGPGQPGLQTTGQPGQLTLPHGVRGALAPYPGWVMALALVFLLAVLIALAVAAWRWVKRRRQNRPVAPSNPWDDLLHRVSALTPRQPFTKEAQEDFFAKLSLMLREGIERRTGLPATDRTYQELRIPLRDQSFLPRELGDALLAFLERADLVKFAAAPSDDGEARKAAAQVSAWITSLRPSAEETHAPS